MKEKERIEQELQQILSSRLLENKKQACNFLAYIMDETLAGRGERITQYGIAIEALGKTGRLLPYRKSSGTGGSRSGTPFAGRVLRRRRPIQPTQDQPAGWQLSAHHRMGNTTLFAGSPAL